MQMEKVSDLRPSPIAGQWYTGDSRRLAEEVDQYIAEAILPKIRGKVMGVIAPRAFKGMECDLVVVVSPLHSYADHPLLTSAHRAYTTPLGFVEIDSQAVDQLTEVLHKSGGEQLYKVANDREHSLEIELPFLQRALAGTFKLLPLMLHTQEKNVAENIGVSLAKVLKDRNFLLVASTDLSHFYPQNVAQRLDKEMLRQMAEFSPEGILNAERRGTGYACGASAVAAVLWAARELGADQVNILHHSTSGEVTGDFDSVVGYGAAVILKY
jgi:AmmeMemoRadiSam system protein B